MAWRTESAAALDAAVAKIEAAGSKGVWKDRGVSHGRSYEFTGPYGHPMKLIWDVKRFQADPEFASTYPDRPEKRSSHAAAPRFLDHVTVACSDVRGFATWYSDTLGFRTMAFTDLDEAPITVFCPDHQRKVPRPGRRAGHLRSCRTRQPHRLLGGHPRGPAAHR